jgi:leucyl aminopeptidase
MKISLAAKSVFSLKLPAIVLFAFENERPDGPAAFKNLLRPASPKEFKGGEKQLLLLHTAGKLAAERVLLAGLGPQNAFNSDALRRATGLAVKKIRDAGISCAAIQITDNIEPSLHAVVEAAILAGYKFTEFKAENNDNTKLSSLTLCVPRGFDLPAGRQLVAGAQTVAESANYARAIANMPGNLVFPATLADRARELAKKTGLKCTVLDKPALEKAGFGGLLAVGAGSSHQPRLITLEYRGAGDNAAPIAFVGKAITFDSGGISIKPGDKMDEMKFDKSGGCAVLGLMRAVVKLKLPVNVIGVIAAAENLPSATSYRPGDIVTSYRGKDKRGVTIEVLNTDAEGRIVLGDALAYARELGAAAIVDFATLTGACVIALGQFAAGLMGNDENLIEKVKAAGERTGERCWPLPLWQEYKDKIKSDVADIKNTGGREGGAITAAAFLAKYVGDTPWAHVDIAGTAWTTEERPYYAKGATGFGVRLALDLLRNWN